MRAWVVAFGKALSTVAVALALTALVVFGLNKNPRLVAIGAVVLILAFLTEAYR